MTAQTSENTGRRRGRGRSKASLELIEAAIAILAEIQPCSVRAVCYRLFTMGLLKSMSKGETDKVSRQLVYAREQGLIDWTCIVDETREPERINTFANPDQIIRAAVQQYRRDYWQDQAHRVEVWSEKGTVRGTLAPVLSEYGVTFRVMHGYGSATALYTAAEDSVAGDKPLTVFYAGDFDPSGMHMSEVDLPARLDRYGGSVHIVPVALSTADVAPGTTIPHFDADTKRHDPRYRWFAERHGARCWELDAMSPVILRQRVANAIAGLLDVHRWNRAIEVETAERESMSEFLATWNRSKSRLASKYSKDGAP